MPRFVILRHETPAGSARPWHWDFMLEAGGALRTWALDEEPSLGRQIAAEKLADHRLAYLDYEGPVAGDRGAVSRWDSGTYEMIAEAECELVARMSAEKLLGVVRLWRASRGDDWRFCWDGDAGVR